MYADNLGADSCAKPRRLWWSLDAENCGNAPPPALSDNDPFLGTVQPYSLSRNLPPRFVQCPYTIRDNLDDRKTVMQS